VSEPTAPAITSEVEPAAPAVAPKTRNADRWCTRLLTVVTLLVLGRVCAANFVSWDDQWTIAGNANLVHPSLHSLLNIWRSPDPGLYIPLTYTLWWLLAWVSLNPLLFHAANLLVHLFAVLMLFRLLRTLGLSQIAACAGAIVFAIHPLQVESVAWATGMRDVLGGALAIAALWWHVRDRPVAAAIVMLLAVLAKPSSVMLLPMAIAIDRLWLGKSRRQIKARSAGLLVVALIGAALTLFAQRPSFPNVSTPWQRPLVAIDAIAFYVCKLFVPIRLTFDYGRRPVAIFASGQIWWTWLMPAALAVLLLICRVRRWQLAALWFVLPLVPVLGLVPFSFQSISTVADHYAYLAMTGAALLVALCVQRLPRQTAAYVMAALVAVLAPLSFVQAGTWTDDLHLFAHAVAVNPQSAPAWNGLAMYHLRQQDLDGAATDARRAIEADPDYAFARLTMIAVKFRQGDRAGVEEQMRQLLRIYQTQANFDPRLAEAVKARLEQMQNNLPASQPLSPQ
jgi:Tfp pilus assembly protein PilF